MFRAPEKPFWREEPLSDPERHLWEEVANAHHRSVFRQNVSSLVASECMRGSGDLFKAFIGALASLGGQHGPLVDNVNLLAAPNPGDVARYLLNRGRKVPGFGCSFCKDADPIWHHAAVALKVHFPAMQRKVDAVQNALRDAGKNLHPNPSTYTAALAVIVGMRAEIAPYILVGSRLAGWTEQAMKSA